MTMTTVRRARFAGSWYEGDGDALGRSIDRLMAATPRFPQPVYGAVLPHAGHTFSGRGIAAGFAHLPETVEQVLILSPSHYTLLPPATIGYSDFTALETPLGNIAAIGGDPFSRPPFAPMDRAIAAEHAAEMFLPFVKRLLPDAAGAILLIPHIDSAATLFFLADAVAAALPAPERTFIIASSDFTHYGARFGHTPFGTGDLDHIREKVAARDRRYARHLADHRYADILADRLREEPSICGLDPAMLLSRLMALRGLRGEAADYYTSSDILGESDEFVCYATILFHTEGGTDGAHR